MSAVEAWVQVDGGRWAEAVGALVPVECEPGFAECLPRWVVSSLCLLLGVSTLVVLAGEGGMGEGAWVAAGAVRWDGGVAAVGAGAGAGSDDRHQATCFRRAVRVLTGCP